jgi:hypothetical protein
MTSPAPFVPTKNFYFNVNVEGEPRKLDLVECFNGDDIALVFNLLDNAGNGVDVSGAAADFKVSKHFSGNTEIYADDEGGTVDLTSSKVTVPFNTETALQSEGGFKYQLRLTRGGKIFRCGMG